MSSDNVIYTVGYSNHALDKFIGLLTRHGITAIADVRSSPRSRNRDFNKYELSASLKHNGIAYVFLGDELGARREEPECYDNGQVDFGAVAVQPSFLEGIKRLEEGMAKLRVAVMCAEKEPLDCHRTILISRELSRRGIHVRHILADGALEDHVDTERRLLKQMNGQACLFDQGASVDERVQSAYDRRGKQIAYRRASAEHIGPPRPKDKKMIVSDPIEGVYGDAGTRVAGVDDAGR